MATLVLGSGFVRFDRAGEGFLLCLAPCLSDAVQHEPGGLLRNPDVLLQLHAGHALEAGHFQVDGEDPRLRH